MKKQNDDDIADAVRYLSKSLETSMYQPQFTKQAHDLKNLLSKLGIKSARDMGMLSGVLQVEDFEAILKSATFNFGKPDCLMVDPKHIVTFKKALKK